MDYVPGLQGVPAAESKICHIEPQKGTLEYRGYSIESLAEKSTFEETAYLLLKERLPNKTELQRFTDDLRSHRRLKFKIVNLLKLLPENGLPMDALAAALSAMGMFYPDQAVEDKDSRYQAMVRIVAKLPTIVAAWARIRKGDEPVQPRDDLSHAANFLYMLTEKVPDPAVARIFDVCMILHAEHAMNASTFAARITGSTQTDAYSVIVSAVNTLAGPLHGAAAEQALRNLKQLGSADRARSWAEENIRNQQIIPGFGHRAYKVKDPRAKQLQRLMEQLIQLTGRSTTYEVATKLEEVVVQHLGQKGVHANVDFYSGVLYERLGIPMDLFTAVFSMSRVCGWLAHWNEQLQRNALYRPAQNFTGEHNKAYTAIEQRG